MSVEVTYPVEIKQYEVSIKKKLAEIVLDGVELDGNGSEGAGGDVRRVGVIHFDDSHPVGNEDIITRGGFLRMDRSLNLLPGVLALLRNQQPVFLRRDGTLSSSPEG